MPTTDRDGRHGILCPISDIDISSSDAIESHSAPIATYSAGQHCSTRYLRGMRTRPGSRRIGIAPARGTSASAWSATAPRRGRSTAPSALGIRADRWWCATRHSCERWQCAPRPRHAARWPHASDAAIACSACPIESPEMTGRHRGSDRGRARDHAHSIINCRSKFL